MSLLFENYSDIMNDPEVIEEETIEIPAYEGLIDITDNHNIVCEFAENMYKLEAGLYIADAIMEHRMLAGEDMTAVAEATVKEFVDKAITNIQQFASKIIEWFKQIILNIKSTGLQGEAFIKKYGNQLKEKAGKVKGFEATMTGYKLSEIKNMTEFASANNQINTEALVRIINRSVDIAGKESATKEEVDQAISDIAKVKAVYPTREAITATIKNKFSSESVMGIDSVNEIIDYVGNYRSILKKVEGLKATFEKDAKAGIANMKKAQVITTVSRQGEKVRLIKEVINGIKHGLAHSHACYSEMIGIARHAYVEGFAFLRKLASFKNKEGAKESVEETDIPSDESLLESILVSF